MKNAINMSITDQREAVIPRVDIAFAFAVIPFNVALLKR